MLAPEEPGSRGRAAYAGVKAQSGSWCADMRADALAPEEPAGWYICDHLQCGLLHRELPVCRPLSTKGRCCSRCGRAVLKAVQTLHQTWGARDPLWARSTRPSSSTTALSSRRTRTRASSASSLHTAEHHHWWTRLCVMSGCGLYVGVRLSVALCDHACERLAHCLNACTVRVRVVRAPLH